jgi:hypothetical protein
VFEFVDIIAQQNNKKRKQLTNLKRQPMCTKTTNDVAARKEKNYHLVNAMLKFLLKGFI